MANLELEKGDTLTIRAAALPGEHNVDVSNVDNIRVELDKHGNLKITEA